jgi:hypothetical protein
LYSLWIKSSTVLVAVFMVFSPFYETRSSYPCALLGELEKLYSLFL